MRVQGKSDAACPKGKQGSTGKKAGRPQGGFPLEESAEGLDAAIAQKDRKIPAI